MRKPSIEIWLFMILTIGLTVLFLLSSNKWLQALSQALPMFVAILVVLFTKREGKWIELGFTKIGTGRGYGWAIIVASMVAFSFIIAWVFGVVDLPIIKKIAMTQWGRFWFLVKLYLQFSFLLGPILFALAEEIGWRGYLQTRLHHELGAKKAIWITAGCWTLFHYPFFFLSNYNDSGNMWVNVLLFTITIFPLSFLFGWIRIESSSIWPVVMCHALINYVRGFFATLFFIKQPYWTYVTGENGMITFVAWMILVAVLIQSTKTKSSKWSLTS